MHFTTRAAAKVAKGLSKGCETIQNLVFEFGAVVDDFRPGAAFPAEDLA